MHLPPRIGKFPVWLFLCLASFSCRDYPKELPGKHLNTLAAVMETDCEPINLCNVEARFMEASAGVPCGLAPHWA